MVNFKIYNVTDWKTNNCNTHIAQYLRKQRQPDNGQLVEYNMRNIFHGKSYSQSGGEARTRTFYKKPKLSITLDQKSEML